MSVTKKNSNNYISQNRLVKQLIIERILERRTVYLFVCVRLRYFVCACVCLCALLCVCICVILWCVFVCSYAVFPQNTPIISWCRLPPLHILLFLNWYIKKIIKLCPTATAWYQHFHQKPSEYHGGDFQGNQLQRLSRDDRHVTSGLVCVHVCLCMCVCLYVIFDNFQIIGWYWFDFAPSYDAPKRSAIEILEFWTIEWTQFENVFRDRDVQYNVL